MNNILKDLIKERDFERFAKSMEHYSYSIDVEEEIDIVSTLLKINFYTTWLYDIEQYALNGEDVETTEIMVEQSLYNHLDLLEELDGGTNDRLKDGYDKMLSIES